VTTDAKCGRIPVSIRRSPLLRQGGFAVVDGLLYDSLFRSLVEEAVSRCGEAVESFAETSDDELWRGGSPARRFLSVSGGEVQDAMYHAPGMGRVLADLCGFVVRPTGGRGTFTYYARPGDYLAIHRDVHQCDLAVITCLRETHPNTASGKLAVYPGRTSETLQTLRATPAKGCRPLPLHPGQTALLLGGIVPHQVLPVVAGQVRIASILCYEISGAAS
jgi:hypothetical protein